MKLFSQFCLEAYDASVMGSSQIKKTGQRGEIGADRRKSEPEKRRMKNVGGGVFHFISLFNGTPPVV